VGEGHDAAPHAVDPAQVVMLSGRLSLLGADSPLDGVSLGQRGERHRLAYWVLRI
jgi:hypothetical protein